MQQVLFCLILFQLPGDKFVKKKITFRKIFHSMWNFFRIRIFSWLFSWFFRVINVYQFSFTLNMLFDKVDSRKAKARKKKFVRRHWYRYFLKNCYGWPKLITCSYTCREQVLYRKNDFRHLTLKKNLKRFITKYIHQLYIHQVGKICYILNATSLLRATFVDGSIF